jgi:hypothetical protein
MKSAQPEVRLSCLFLLSFDCLRMSALSVQSVIRENVTILQLSHREINMNKIYKVPFPIYRSALR